MTRLPTILLCAAVLAAVGCRAFEERAGLFPRLRDAVDPDANHRQPYYRYADRGSPYSDLPYSHTPYQPAVIGGSCLPCSGVGSYPGGTTLATPAVIGGGYAVPTTYSPSPSYPSGSSSGPVLGTPTYPNGEGSPYRPRRDDELPQPGGYSQPGAAEMGRGVAPKPPTSLPTGR
jgi:hypothetical protein